MKDGIFVSSSVRYVTRLFHIVHEQLTAEDEQEVLMVVTSDCP